MSEIIEEKREVFDVESESWDGPFETVDANGKEITDKIRWLNRMTGEAKIIDGVTDTELRIKAVTYPAPLRIFRKE